MKNRKTAATLILIALLIAANCLTFVFADNVPGSSADPVVTKSYVDSMFNSLKAQIESGEYTVSGETPDMTAASESSFIVVQIAAGESLIGEGGTEIILRSGQASGVSQNQDGLSDVTTGKDIKAGASVEKNHLLIVPRSDGRGIKCSTSAYIMVKGAYSIQ